jgi:hypothetical protein
MKLSKDNNEAILNAGVAQLVEQLTCNQQVGGSSPLASSILSDKWFLIIRLKLAGFLTFICFKPKNPSNFMIADINF